MAGIIGIKIANGDFYPIIEEEFPVEKRLVLTTVHDRQKSVQIDLFRSEFKTMMDAQYIGSLVIENIKPRPRGEPSIEMLISIDSKGNIHADAYIPSDLDNGEHHILNVSLKTMDSQGENINFPDFDIENDLFSSSDGFFSSSNPPNLSSGKKSRGKKFTWLIMICATILVIIAIAAIWYFFLGGAEMFSTSAIEEPSLEQSDLSKLITEEEILVPPAGQILPQEIFEKTIPPDVPIFQAKPAEPVKTETAPIRRVHPPAPVLSYKVPAVIPKGGTRYLVRWGDTLWEIAQAFYRNPWLYKEIARANDIKNPDHIVTGFWVKIPFIP